MSPELLIVGLPLLGALLSGLFSGLLNKRGCQIVTCVCMGVSCLLSWVVLFDVGWGGHDRSTLLLTWVSVSSFSFDWVLRVDTLSAVMFMVVTTVSLLVHVYSVGYMAHDASIPRFMAYLSLFTFTMLMLVSADNLVQMFFGWEGVGLMSYLLIGFWHHKGSANSAAVKAFVVNRVGDVGFALGIFALYVLTDSVTFSGIFAALPGLTDQQLVFLGYEIHAVTLCCLLLFLGAMGKSAQLGLHTWLPDAMEGPTPVSALIHAATMVTAGVFMLCRMSPLFEHSETALMVVTVVGASTALFAASVGLTQNDIKRVIAYSTCSQLGYMFFAIGVSAYPAAMFHLTTHAFFKALLFLGAGSVIHAMSNEQDMRRMGGISHLVPLTYTLMWIGSLSLAGVPPFAGYFSKDLIIESAWAAHSPVGAYAFWLGVAAAFMTAFYSWRLLFMTFHGLPKADEHVMGHVHESPLVMGGPLVLLGIGAMLSGWLLAPSFVGSGMDGFWRESIVILDHHTALHDAHHAPLWVKALPLGLGIVGIVLAWLMYVRFVGLPGWVSRVSGFGYRLSYNKWYFDELYDAVFVRRAFRLGIQLWRGGDEKTIDALGPNGVAHVTRLFGVRMARVQSGYLYHYVFAMIIGLMLLVGWMALRSIS